MNLRPVIVDNFICIYEFNSLILLPENQMTPMNVIIFSKDRAAQLDLLLRSMPEWFDEVYVIWTASDTGYWNAYQILMNEIPDNVMFVQQHMDFKDDVVWYADSPNKYTMFLTDDDVFINERAMSYARVLADDRIACVSLRLNPSLPFCYTLNRRQWPPKDMKDGIWDWRNADADYGYPMSLDGHIFRTDDILPLLTRLSYGNPNELEGRLARHPINRPLMMCYDKSIIVNNPINRVQDTVKNRHGNITAEYLNEMFLSGKRISLEPFIGYANSACHAEIEITWE